MIQFNLLPDVKLEYIRTRRTKRTVTMLAVITAGTSLGLLILLFIVVNFIQKGHLNNLNDDIKTHTATLQETPDLDKILTVQNQLNSLTGLHSQKPKVTRLNNYLQQITPANVSLSELTLDFVGLTLQASGTAGSLADVNKFADTLKFTTYGDDQTTAPAFSEVVLNSFSVESDGTVSYQITAKYDSAIFDSTKNVILTVPNTVTTRSATDRPEALFQENTSVEEEN